MTEFQILISNIPITKPFKDYISAMCEMGYKVIWQKINHNGVCYLAIFMELPQPKTLESEP